MISIPTTIAIIPIHNPAILGILLTSSTKHQGTVRGRNYGTDGARKSTDGLSAALGGRVGTGRG